MNLIPFLLDTATKITPSAGEAAGKAASAVQKSTATPGFMDTIMKNPIGAVIVYVVVVFGIMYVFSIRPTKKREKALSEKRNSLEVGDDVVLNNGFYGKIADVTATCFIIEFGTNRGVRIPVVKSEVYGKAEPNLSNKIEEIVEEPKKKGFFSKKEKTEE